MRHAVMDDQVVTDLGVIRAAFDRTFERSTLQLGKKSVKPFFCVLVSD